MEISLIYPNQLFQNNPVVSFDRKIYLLRHPIFFKSNNYLFNKKKILLHLLSVQNYFEKLTDLGYEVQIVEENNYEQFKLIIETNPKLIENIPPPVILPPKLI